MSFDDTKRSTLDAGTVELKIVFNYNPEDSYLQGVLWTRKGWYWHFAAISPAPYEGNVAHLSGTMIGPFPTRHVAELDASRKLGGEDSTIDSPRSR